LQELKKSKVQDRHLLEAVLLLLVTILHLLYFLLALQPLELVLQQFLFQAFLLLSVVVLPAVVALLRHLLSKAVANLVVVVLAVLLLLVIALHQFQLCYCLTYHQFQDLLLHFQGFVFGFVHHLRHYLNHKALLHYCCRLRQHIHYVTVLILQP